MSGNNNDYDIIDDDEEIHCTHSNRVKEILYAKNWVDLIQWHLEDVIRDPDITPVDALVVKRRIDDLNKQRTDLVESLDDYFLKKYSGGFVKLKDDATINSESPAWAIDRLSILSIRIYHMQEQSDRLNTSIHHKLKCQERLSILLEQKYDLSKSIDQLLNDIESGKKQMKELTELVEYTPQNEDEMIQYQKLAINNQHYQHQLQEEYRPQSFNKEQNKYNKLKFLTSNMELIFVKYTPTKNMFFNPDLNFTFWFSKIRKIETYLPISNQFLLNGLASLVENQSLRSLKIIFSKPLIGNAEHLDKFIQKINSKLEKFTYISDNYQSIHFKSIRFFGGGSTVLQIENINVADEHFYTDFEKCKIKAIKNGNYISILPFISSHPEIEKVEVCTCSFYPEVNSRPLLESMTQLKKLQIWNSFKSETAPQFFFRCPSSLEILTIGCSNSFNQFYDFNHGINITYLSVYILKDNLNSILEMVRTLPQLMVLKSNENSIFIDEENGLKLFDSLQTSSTIKKLILTFLPEQVLFYFIQLFLESSKVNLILAEKPQLDQNLQSLIGLYPNLEFEFFEYSVSKDLNWENYLTINKK
eukprot:gene3828-4769_t